MTSRFTNINDHTVCLKNCHPFVSVLVIISGVMTQEVRNNMLEAVFTNHQRVHFLSWLYLITETNREQCTHTLSVKNAPGTTGAW